jgi:hypothetical protein
MKFYRTPVPKSAVAFQSAKSVLRILRRSSFLSRLPYRDADAGECIVLGNGPSLKSDYAANPGFFANRRCFCVNSFALTDLFLDTRPSHYVLLDPAYYEAHTSPALVELRTRLFKAIEEKLAWPMTLLLPQQAKAWLSRQPIASHPKLTIAYFNTTPVRGFDGFCHPAFRANLGMPWAGTVVVGAVYAALNLGFKRVFMFGADHTWHENLHLTKDNIVCLKDKHFYDSADPKPSPFYEDPNEEYAFTMTSLFQRLSDIFGGYEYLMGYARYLGADLYNLGSGSFVDAFPRLTLDEASRLGART